MNTLEQTPSTAPAAHNNTRRKKIYIYKDFQRSFVFGFCIASFGAMMAISLILVFLIILCSAGDSGSYLPLLIWVNVIVMAALVALTFIVALHASHKIGGPLYRFEQSMAMVADGDLTVRITLREGDQLKKMANGFNDMGDSLCDKVRHIKTQVSSLNALSKTNLDREKIVAELKNLDVSINGLFETESASG